MEQNRLNERQYGGLCADCANCRIIANPRGSVFFFCKHSREDKRYPKYPRTPVAQCAAHQKGEPESE